MITRYVNTASTVGTQDGTTNTPGNSGTAAFESLRTALNSLGASLSDAATIWCSGTAADTLNCTQAHLDFQTSATNYLRIVGDNITGKWNTSAYRIEVTDASAFYNNNLSHVRLENLQHQITATTSIGTNYNCFRLATANNNVTPVDHRYTSCIARAVRTGTDHIVGFIDSDPAGSPGGGTCVRINCIAYGNGYCGFNSDGGTWAQSNCINYNCTAYGMAFNYLDPQINYNCIGDSNTTGDGFDFLAMSPATQSHNCSGDSSATGTGSLINKNTTIHFVNAGIGTDADFHLLSNSICIEAGVNDPGGGLYSADIDGQTRTSTWDIGADEYVDAGGGGGSLLPSRHPMAHLLVR